MLPLVLVASAALAAQAPAASTAPARAEAAFVLPEMRGLIEGIAFRPKTGAYYFGDVYLRYVWMRAADGRVTRTHKGAGGLAERTSRPARCAAS